MTLLTLLYLYIGFRIKHFLCDFLFQTDWMALTKGIPGAEGRKALLIHAFIHGIGTFALTMIFAPSLWWLGPLDFVVHGIVDRVKGMITYKRQWTPKSTKFWWAIGFDQEMHNYTHLVYMLLIITALGGITV